MNILKRILVFSFLGGLIGVFLAAYFAPSMISWYFQPPVSMGIDCRNAVEWAISRFIVAEIGGAALGMLVFGSVALYFVRRKK